MSVISVEIDKNIAKSINPFEVIKFNDLEKIVYTKQDINIDFGKEGVLASDILSHLKSK